MDAGLGLGFDAFVLSVMRFEAWHQMCKNHGRQGMGRPMDNVHEYHGHLTDKSAAAMDAELHTLGRIPPTRALRERFSLVPKAVFDTRYHRRMLRPRHGSRPLSAIPGFDVDVCAADRSGALVEMTSVCAHTRRRQE